VDSSQSVTGFSLDFLMWIVATALLAIWAVVYPYGLGQPHPSGVIASRLPYETKRRLMLVAKNIIVDQQSARLNEGSFSFPNLDNDRALTRRVEAG
jgi:hypothetical protein